MKNKNNTEFINTNRGIFIDPNSGNENVQIENLSIEVDLRVFDRKRSLIKIDETNTEEDGKNKKLLANMRGGTASFNQGQKFGDKYAFTTSYTEVSHIDYDGSETLGITNVEIEFNSSYMPMITVEMTDVRGKLFQKGNESPFGAFFNFPYPMFELKVKGYFGKPVTFLLHLTKFNTKLESGSGNFKINCNFIGYTFAYLSDMLLGYLKAIPHTDIGERLMKAKGPNFISFEQLYEYSNRLQEKIQKLRKSGEIKALTRAYEVLGIYQEIINKINDKLLDVDGINYATKNTENVIAFIKPENIQNMEPLRQLLKIVKSESEYANQTEITGEKYDLDVNLFQLVDKENYFHGLMRNDFLDEDNAILSTYGGSFYTFKDEDFKFIAAKLQAAPTVTDGFSMVFFKKMINHINEKSEALNSIVKDKQNGFAAGNLDELTSVRIQDSQGNDIDFDFNLYNYTKVLSDHVDLFMECIEEIAGEAEGNAARTEELKRDATKMYDIREVEDLKTIYAFPDYKTKKSSGGPEVFTDTWIGGEHPNINEAIFVRDLYEGFIEAKKKDNEWREELINTTPTQWYGVNPFDSGLYTDYQNVWESVKSRKGNEGNIIRLMTLRALVFLNVSVRNPTPKEVTAMAKLEANNLFNTLENDIAKGVIAMIGNSLEQDDIVKAIRGEVETGNEHHANDFAPINKNALLSPEFKHTGGYEFKLGTVTSPITVNRSFDFFEDYIYIGGHETAKTVNEMIDLVDEEGKIPGMRTFLPLYFSGNADNFKGNSIISKNGGGLASNEDRIKLREAGNIFFSDYLGPVAKENNKPDDGGTFIDFLLPEEYDEEVSPPLYASKVVGDTEIDDKRIFTKDELSGIGKEGSTLSNVNYNGHWYNLEFLNYTVDGNTYGFHNYFYRDETVTKSIPELEMSFLSMKEKKEKPYTLHHIFGTNFYYQQNKYGRALLFLHSLPFKRDKDKIFNDEILPLFSHKASFIKVPKSWVLLIGGLLYRYNKEVWVEEKNGYKIMPTRVSKISSNKKGLDAGNIVGNMSDKTFTYGFGNEPTDFDIILEKLPASVKNRFIKEFTDWVEAEDGFKVLQNYLELFDNEKGKDTPNIEEIAKLFRKDSRQLPLDGSVSIMKKNIRDTYKLVQTQALGKAYKKIDGSENLSSVIPDIMDDYGNIFNLIPIIDEKSSIGALHLMSFMDSSFIMVNGTWRIWVNDESKLPWGGNTATIDGSSLPFSSNYRKFNAYVTEFIKEFLALKQQEDLAEASIRSEIFNNTNLDEVYLTIYKNIKSIYDKWITGRDKKMVTYRNLIDNFVFIDRGYNDIGSEFKLNPEHITALLTSSYNNSFYSHMSNILTNNNFNFIPLPTYIDLTNQDEMSNLFHPYDYNANVNSVKSAFVCMYKGENSSKLEGNDDYNDDSLQVLDMDGLPEDFNQVPGIFVNYGDENQSIFTSIELDQTEFSETNESILTTDQIANSYNSVSTVGQNLFNVYNNRAYNATVGMLGNAMMQPFMYFQLNNIPMFRGAYVVVSVNHSITPNHMTSSIKGNRVKRVKTQLIDKEAIFFNLLGPFGDIQAGEGNLDDLDKIPSADSNSRSTTSGNGSINASNYNEDPYNYTFTRTIGKDYNFNIPSNTKKKNSSGSMVAMTYDEIFTEVNKLTGIPILTLKTMSVIETKIGQYKGKFFKENYMNESGYVGLMQFHRSALDDVQKNVNSVLGSSDFKFSEYEFGAIVDGSKKINYPSVWNADPTKNNPQTNSMFDDFINTLAAAFYMKKTSDQGKWPYSHVTNLYLAHQQGYSGLKTIINEPLSTFENREGLSGIPKNMQNNLPMKYDHTKSKYSYQEWYLAWAGHVEGIASDIDGDAKLSVGNPDDNTRLSKSFVLSQFKSKDGATTPPAVIAELKRLCAELEVIKEYFGGAKITINSGYRSPEHNKAEGGVSDSQHLFGRAADIVVSGYTPTQVRAGILKLISEGKLAEGGLGKYNSFTHYDIRGHQSRWFKEYWANRSNDFDPNIDGQYLV